MFCIPRHGPNIITRCLKNGPTYLQSNTKLYQMYSKLAQRYAPTSKKLAMKDTKVISKKTRRQVPGQNSYLRGSFKRNQSFPRRRKRFWDVQAAQDSFQNGRKQARCCASMSPHHSKTGFASHFEDESRKVRISKPCLKDICSNSEQSCCPQQNTKDTEKRTNRSACEYSGIRKNHCKNQGF